MDEESGVRALPILLQEENVKVRVRIGPSPIAGKGLFAAQDIKKGTRIIQYLGQRISTAETADRL